MLLLAVGMRASSCAAGRAACGTRACAVPACSVPAPAPPVGACGPQEAALVDAVQASIDGGSPLLRDEAQTIREQLVRAECPVLGGGSRTDAEAGQGSAGGSARERL